MKFSLRGFSLSHLKPSKKDAKKGRVDGKVIRAETARAPVRSQTASFVFAPASPHVSCTRLLSQEEAHNVEKSAESLGDDESSINFATRRKNIAFVLRVGDKWLQVRQNYFNQAEAYNDATGGYRRYYRELPSTFVEDQSVIKLLNAFVKKFNIPDGEMSLVQVQTSVIRKQDEGKCLTGQGIHSDGADVAMLAVLRRQNVAGARSAVFGDPWGCQTLFGPQPLRAGEVMFWQDNAVYHYVEPARLLDQAEGGLRTVLIAHYPARHYITGEKNRSNNLAPSGHHPPYMMSDV